MSYIYTHIWQDKNNNFYSEGQCHTSYEDALNDLYDYMYCWLDRDNSYYCTYVDDLTSNEIRKINMTKELGNFCEENDLFYHNKNEYNQNSNYLI